MSPIVATFLKTAALPAALATVALYIAGLRGEPLRERLQSVIFALAFAAGAYLLLNRLSVPPHDVSESFTYVALLLGAFVFVAPAQLGARYFLRMLFVVAVGAILLWHLRSSLNTTVHYRNMLAFFFLALGVWSIMDKMGRSVSMATYVLLPLISAAGLSLYLLFSGSASFANLVTILCALLGGALLLAAVMPRKLSQTALTPFVSVFVIAFMAAGHFYLDANPWKMIFFCVPFLVLWVRDWFPFIPRNPVAEVPVLGLIAGAPVAYFVYQAYKVAGPLY